MPLFGMSRSKFGKWLERHEVSQVWLEKRSGVSNSTISDLVRGKTKRPTAKVGRKLIRALRSIDLNVSERDFWI